MPDFKANDFANSFAIKTKWSLIALLRKLLELVILVFKKIFAK